MELFLLSELVILGCLSIAVLLICAGMRVPAIVGLILTGVISGPHGLAVIDSVEHVKSIAEVGVILLLFVIGIEFSLKRLIQIKRLVLLGGALQVGITVAVGALIIWLRGWSLGPAVFCGFLVALSSTAVVLKLLQESGQVETPHGQSVLAILIFQDIAVVPMMMVTPFLAGAGDAGAGELLWLFIKALIILVAVLIAAQLVVPFLLHQVARTRNTQLFNLAILCICFLVAWVTSSLGLSLALGAFLAGLIISESEYSLHATGFIIPFEQVFTSFFFMSIGMLLNLGFFADNLLGILEWTGIVVVAKLLIAGLVMIALGYPIRTAIIVGMSLCQMGEFGFILSDVGVNAGMINPDQYQVFLAVSLLTMGLAPLWIHLAPKLVDWVHRLKLPAALLRGRVVQLDAPRSSYKDHVVIVGFGVCGQNLARVAEIAKVPYTILETNPETVRREREKGRPIYFGDASQRPVLEHVNIDEARIAVVAINDPVATRRTVEVIRSVNPRIYIIARTPYIQELEPITELGANEVIPEDFEVSVDIFGRVLKRYLIPQDEIEAMAADIRAQGYKLLRQVPDEPHTLRDFALNLSDMEIGVYRLPGGAPFVGKTLEESQIRQQHKVTVLMIRRGRQVIPNPPPRTELRPGDTLVVFGGSDLLVRFAQLCRA